MNFQDFNIGGNIVSVFLGGSPIGDITAERIAKWYVDRENNLLDDVEKNWNGSFSVVIKDDLYITAFTDPHGVDQLYYTVPDRQAGYDKDRSGIQFARFISELPASGLDAQYFSEVRKWGYNTDNRTPWQNIKRVMPGEVVVYDPTARWVYRSEAFAGYFTRPNNYIESQSYGETLRNLVHNAVQTRVQALGEDVKTIAMLLSGGLDSSCIAYELLGLQKAGLLGGRDLVFYTINNADDAPFVKEFADQFGIIVTTLSYDMDAVDLDNALRINETPVDLGSMVPNQCMFDVIPETVIFTGDGPDEMLGGYNRIDQYDSQLSDTFEELSFYHYPRLNKAAHHYGKTLVCPYTDREIVAFALAMPFSERTHKKVLKDAYRGLIPDSIIARQKLPLKNDELRKDPLAYRFKIAQRFIDIYTK